MVDLLKRVDVALDGTVEENAWDNFSANPIPDEGRTVQNIASIALEQTGRVTVKTESLTKPVTNLLLPS